MKKIFPLPFIFILITIGTIFNACSVKEAVCEDKSVQSEQATIVNYAATQGISATAHSSGVYYQIMNPGSGPTPNNGSRVFVKYTGKLLNGTVFDQQTTPVSYGLGGLILGWQVGLPLIQKGGIIKLIVPSSMAYGCRGFGTVGGNEILYFEIELTDVQ
ncbi:MAG: peptidylprolyl isomerase [Chitinophagaceae bacterium]|nr:peptidylprolyl isomerase [Chitinophagaceae bacterium]